MCIRDSPRTDLPGPWRDYLAHGALPLIRVDDPDHPRSNYEATATAVLLRHGYDADEAWRTIQAAHPSAFTTVSYTHLDVYKRQDMHIQVGRMAS